MISFVILHYIVVEETIKCVNSILTNVSGKKSIIIVDNASPNDSYEELSNYFANEKQVTLLHSENNLGFARGNNLGYEFAVKNYSPDFVVVMNNDMEICQANFTDELYKSYQNYEYYIMGPDIYSTQKKYHQNPQTRKLPTKNQLKENYRKLKLKSIFKFLLPVKWCLFAILGKKSVSNEDRSHIPFVSEVVLNPMLHGSCYVFSKKFIDKYPDKCFYDKTFMYLEAEILYYLSIRRNEKMIYYPNIKIDHHEDVATDMAFKKQYQKSIFSIECLLQSTKAFLELIEEEEKA